MLRYQKSVSQYSNEDKLTVLKCNDRHYFHTECIEEWVLEREPVCPICLNGVEVLNASFSFTSSCDCELMVTFCSNAASHV